MLKQHFVVFLSPGTFVAETSSKEIDSWDAAQAIVMMSNIKERHGATPYGFYFITRSRRDDQLDSEVTAKSPMYYVGGKVETLEEILERNDPNERILRSNMESNDYKRIWTTTKGYKWTQPLNDTDVVLLGEV